jgi:tetratricopeptide (TPR) repeat protein
MGYLALFGIVAAVVGYAHAVAAKTPAEVQAIGRAVTVEIKLPKSTRFGSGVIVHRQGDLYTLVTNRHVVCGSRSCTGLPSAEIYNLGTADGLVYQVPVQQVQLLDRYLDLAIVQFRSKLNYPVAQVANLDDLRVGDLIYTTGFPFQPPGFVFGEGKAIAVVHKRLTMDGGGYTIVYDAETLPGMSGGGVFDQAGRLVAIHGLGDRFRTNTELDSQSKVGSKIGYNRGIPVRWLVQSLAQRKIFIGQSAAVQNAPNLVASTSADEHFIAGFNLFVEPGTEVQSGKQAAIEELSQAIRINPNYAIAYHLRAYVHVQLQSYPQALADYNRSIVLNPKFAKAYNNRGQLKVDRLQDPKGALADFDAAIVLNPRYAAAYNNRGTLKADNLNDPNGALLDYGRAISLNPQFAAGYYNRGSLKADRLQDFPGALADYDQAIALNPKYGNAYNNRGQLKANRLNDLPGALADFNEAIGLNPQDAGAFYNRGILYQKKLKDPSNAIADFRVALRLFKEQGKTNYVPYVVDRLRELGINEGS